MRIFTPNRPVRCTEIKLTEQDEGEFIPDNIYEVDDDGFVIDERGREWSTAFWAEFEPALEETPVHSALYVQEGEIPAVAGALKFDDGKMNPLLLEQDLADPLMVVNAVLQYGVNKYGARGGWKGVDAERYEAALARHRRAHLRGEQLDPESGLPHWAHAICNELFLAYFQVKGMTASEVDAMATPNAPPGAEELK